MSFLACLPLIAADIPAVLALDLRCLGGLWTHSGYTRELESDCSDLFVLVSTSNRQLLQQRSQLNSADAQSDLPSSLSYLAAKDPTDTPNVEELSVEKSSAEKSISLLGVGCLWAILEEAHITTLAIEPSCQGQKLGQLLLSHLLLAGCKRGLTRATLEVRSSNQKALSLYQKFGFKEAGERKRYYSDGENARILWRSQLQQEDCLQLLTQLRQSAISHIEIVGENIVLAESS